MQPVEVYSRDQKFKYAVDAFGANHSLNCFACSTCSVECPVNVHGGRLDPRRIIQMAVLGMESELLEMPEIWLCLNCKKCANVCPQGVDPSKVIAMLRRRAVEKGAVTPAFAHLAGDLDVFFHRVRHRCYQRLATEKQPDQPLEIDEFILDTAVQPEKSTDFPEKDVFHRQAVPRKFADTHFNRCLICRECTVSCVIARHVSLFDPARFVRMHLLGMEKGLEASAELWLCLGCETCTAVCRQGVKVHQLIKMLEQKMITGGRVTFSVSHVEALENGLQTLRRRTILLAYGNNGIAASTDAVDLMKAARTQE